MPWSSLATNQCVSLNNLRDAIANGIFVAISAVPTGDKEITKTEALAYVDIQTSPLASKASNQLVVKNNLSAKVYTYNRYDLNLTQCTTSNPIPVWSYFDIPYGSYKINNLYIYQIIPATHSTFNNQITSYEGYTCTPVTRYSYTLYQLNASTCATSNPQQWWSYNQYADGNYYVNNPYDLFSLYSASHTNYTQEITSVSIGSCGTTPTKYNYILYAASGCTLNQNPQGYGWSYANVAEGWYYVNVVSNYVYVYKTTTDYTYYPEITSFTPTNCIPDQCLYYVFENTNKFNLNLNETFTYISCAGVSTTLTLAPYAYAERCVQGNTTPGTGNRGDIPYTFGFACTI